MTPAAVSRAGLTVGPYWGRALATAAVAALVGLVAWFVIERAADQELRNPPFGDDGAAVWSLLTGVLSRTLVRRARMV